MNDETWISNPEMSPLSRFRAGLGIAPLRTLGFAGCTAVLTSFVAALAAGSWFIERHWGMVGGVPGALTLVFPIGFFYLVAFFAALFVGSVSPNLVWAPSRSACNALISRHTPPEMVSAIRECRDGIDTAAELATRISQLADELASGPARDALHVADKLAWRCAVRYRAAFDSIPGPSAAGLQRLDDATRSHLTAARELLDELRNLHQSLSAAAEARTDTAPRAVAGSAEEDAAIVEAGFAVSELELNTRAYEAVDASAAMRRVEQQTQQRT